jgi:hypothetical protein
MHLHRMDDWDSANTQANARDTPIALVAGRCILALLASGLRLASAPPWGRLPPLTH